MDVMRTLPLVVILACAAVAHAQQPQSFTPSSPPRPNEETILNARVVSVDTAGNRLTVRGVDVKADGGRDETFAVGPRATPGLAGLKAGAGVLLVLRGTTVIEIRPSAAPETPAPAAAGRGTTTRRGTTAATRTSGSAAARTPRPAVTPQPAVSPAAAPAQAPAGGSQAGVVIDGTAPIVQITPVPQGAATPFPTPLPVPTPIPVATPPSAGTPTPVLLPSTPPSPASTPAATPSPVTSPVTP